MKPVNYKTLNWQQRKAIREQYIREQDLQCYFCGVDLMDDPDIDIPIDWSLFPENFLKYPVHLQHNHKTGLTEGAVHAYCNALMWNYLGR